MKQNEHSDHTPLSEFLLLRLLPVLLLPVALSLRPPLTCELLVLLLLAAPLLSL
jgi:hypothetical protein